MSPYANYKKGAIVGAYEYPLRSAPGKTANQVQAECLFAALEDAGLSIGDVDGLCATRAIVGAYEYPLRSPAALDAAHRLRRIPGTPPHLHGLNRRRRVELRALPAARP